MGVFPGDTVIDAAALTSGCLGGVLLRRLFFSDFSERCDMKIIVFLGAPGAGKGTAAARLAARTSAVHVSTGAMLRDALKRGTPAGLAAKSYMESGGLVPDETLVDMIRELLTEAPKDAVFLFDGFPRNEKQAAALDMLAGEFGATVGPAVCLEVPEDVIMARLGGRRVCPSCGAGFHVESMPPKKEGICDVCGAELTVRADDRPETIRHRLEVYEKQTAPLLSWYEKAGSLRRVDASGDADAVADAIMGFLAGK